MSSPTSTIIGGYSAPDAGEVDLSQLHRTLSSCVFRVIPVLGTTRSPIQKWLNPRRNDVEVMAGTKLRAFCKITLLYLEHNLLCSDQAVRAPISSTNLSILGLSEEATKRTWPSTPSAPSADMRRKSGTCSGHN